MKHLTQKKSEELSRDEILKKELNTWKKTIYYKKKCYGNDP